MQPLSRPMNSVGPVSRFCGESTQYGFLRSRRWGLVLTALLAGCGGGASVPADHFYRLAPPAVETRLSAPLLPAALAVRRPRSDALLAGRALVYSDATQPLKLKSFHYRLWTEPPARLVQQHLVSYLRDRGVADIVYRGAPRHGTDYVLAGRLLRFEQRRQSPRPNAVVALELTLRAPDGSVVFTQRFERVVTAESPALHDTVSAISAALAGIESELVEGLSRLSIERP